MTKTFGYEIIPNHTLFGCNPIREGYTDLLFAHYPEHFERGATVTYPTTTEPETMIAIRFPDKLAFDHFCRFVNRVQKELEDIKNKEDKTNG